MQNSDKRSIHSHPSLFPLQAALIAAESGVPSSPDINERRAQILIAKMKTEYRKPLPFTRWKDDETLNSFRLKEVIGSHV